MRTEEVGPGVEHAERPEHVPDRVAPRRVRRPPVVVPRERGALRARREQRRRGNLAQSLLRNLSQNVNQFLQNSLQVSEFCSIFNEVP